MQKYPVSLVCRRLVLRVIFFPLTPFDLSKDGSNGGNPHHESPSPGVKILLVPSICMLFCIPGRAVPRLARTRASGNWHTRALTSTPCRAEQAPSTPTGSAYPFATHVVARSHVVPRSNSVRAPPPDVKHLSRGVMPRVDSQLTTEMDPDERIARLFSRQSPDCIPPGSIVMVESYLNNAKTSSTTFSGVLIAVRRSGIATTFVLRAIAHKLGVEMRFHAYSPMIKDIKVLQRADAKKRQPGLTRTRRAKLYYMRRKDDRRVASVANVVKQYRAAVLQQKGSSSTAGTTDTPAKKSSSSKKARK